MVTRWSQSGWWGWRVTVTGCRVFFWGGNSLRNKSGGYTTLWMHKKSQSVVHVTIVNAMWREFQPNNHNFKRLNLLNRIKPKESNFLHPLYSHLFILNMKHFCQAPRKWAEQLGWSCLLSVLVHRPPDQKGLSFLCNRVSIILAPCTLGLSI